MYQNKPVIISGIIGEKTYETDYQLSGDIDVFGKKVPVAKNTFDKNKIQYNQNEVHANSCSIHGAIGAFSDLTGYVFSLEERKKLWEDAKKLGASENYGWYLVDAVDLVRKYVNTLGIGKFLTVRIAIGYDEFYEVLSKGYSVATSYNGDQDYNNDLLDDGVIQTGKVGDREYGHLIRANDPDCKTKTRIRVIDNYKGSETWKNIYEIEDINNLMKNGTWNSSGYIFMYDEPDLPIDTKLVERCKKQFIAITKPSKDGSKPSGEIFYCNKNAEIITMNSAGYELKHQMLLDSKCINISKDDLHNFKKIDII